MLKLDEQNCAQHSDKDNNSSSAPKQRQNEPKPEHTQVAMVLCIQDDLLPMASFQTRSA